MKILSIYSGHNATAALFIDGEIVACASEERFRNIKNYSGFPKRAIDYCLKKARLRRNEVDLIAIPYRLGAPIHSQREVGYSFLLKFLVTVQIFINFFRKIWGLIVYELPFLRPIGEVVFRIFAYPVGSFNVYRERKTIAKYFRIDLKKVKCFDHHTCHAASAYYSSPYGKREALVITLDGEGDFLSSTVSIFDREKVRRIGKTKREASLGYIYDRLTRYLGMKANEHEYKIMGLAPYAKKENVDRFYKNVESILYLDKQGSLGFRSRFNTVDTDKFLERKMKKIRFDVLAGIFQKFAEEKMTQLVRRAVLQTNLTTVCCAGGVFMNVKANQKVSEIGMVKKMFVMPSASDESSTIGSCYLGHLFLGGKASDIRPIRDLYWGPIYTKSEVKDYLSKQKSFSKYEIKFYANIETKVAELLAKNKIVARMAGRMEFGARAFGNRSILANPSDYEVIRVINEQIKSRDFWMPFAPTILAERMSDYVVNPKKIPAWYMIFSFNSTSLAREELKAGLHPSDFTLRPQILTPDFNPRYYKIVKEFEKLTGIGGVLNTSFNLHGFPIVMGPKQALDTFENSGLEYLAMENFLIKKKNKNEKNKR